MATHFQYNPATCSIEHLPSATVDSNGEVVSQALLQHTRKSDLTWRESVRQALSLPRNVWAHVTRTSVNEKKEFLLRHGKRNNYNFYELFWCLLPSIIYHILTWLTAGILLLVLAIIAVLIIDIGRAVVFLLVLPVVMIFVTLPSLQLGCLVGLDYYCYLPWRRVNKLYLLIYCIVILLLFVFYIFVVPAAFGMAYLVFHWFLRPGSTTAFQDLSPLLSLLFLIAVVVATLFVTGYLYSFVYNFILLVRIVWNRMTAGPSSCLLVRSVRYFEPLNTDDTDVNTDKFLEAIGT